MFTLLAIATTLGGCSSSTSLTGKVTTVSANYVPCAGSAADAVQIESKGYDGPLDAPVETLKRIRLSHGLYLQKDFVIRFTGSQEVGDANATSLQIVQTPEYQGGYRWRSCWLGTKDVDALVQADDIGSPVEAAADEYTMPPVTPRPAGSPTLPSLGQTDAVTQRILGRWLWKNADNTQAPNIYNFPYKGDRVELDLQYSKTHDGQKRVNAIDFHRPSGPLKYQDIKAIYIPADAVQRSISSIGGNINDVYGRQEQGESDAAYVSQTLAKLESQWNVKPCDSSSNVPGLLIVETTTNDSGGIDGVTVFDAALGYCAEQLSS